ncbi:hypothetical protein ACMD2_13620 [Ananas comosus]|nr:hypothetical protein ACMD2_13620 [Ananas comosus]
MSEASMESKPPPHPLRQIAESATHKLLLKQWLKEEELLLRRVALRETRLDAARRETTGLFCAFFVFHSTALLLLFSSASDAPAPRTCHRSWIPCLLSLLSSLGLIWAVRYKGDTEKVLERMLEREKEDALLLGKCVGELRKKGAEFDLLKEVDALRRAKSLRVEAKAAAAVRRWSGRDLGIMALFAAACGAVALTRFVLCS